MSEKLTVTQLRIKNIFGIDEFEMSPGSISVLAGKNGAGKSSALNAIKNVIGGGCSLAEIKNVNTGEDENPEIVLHLQGDHEYIVRKTGKTTTVKKQIGDSAAFETVKSPQRFLSSLFDGKMSNPMTFLKADKKNRVTLMLEAIDLDFNREDLFDAICLSPNDFPAVPDGIHPLAEINLHRSNIFTVRTGINRDQKSKREASEQMLASVPAETPKTDSLVEKEELLLKKVDEYGTFSAQAESKKQSALEAIDAEIDVLNDRQRAEYGEYKEQEDIKAIGLVDRLKQEQREFVEANKLKIDKAAQDLIETLSVKKSEIELTSKNKELELTNQAEKVRSNFETETKENESLLPTINTLKEDIAVLKEQKENAIKIDTIKDKAKDFENEASGLKSRSDALSEALAALDDYKVRMCANLPVPGLEIVDNQIEVNGVKWEQLNTAQQIQIAVKIATLRSKKQNLPIIWVDGAEALDSEALTLLKTTLEKEGVQAFIGKVADKELEIEA